MSCCFSNKVVDKRRKKNRVSPSKLESVFESRPLLIDDKKKKNRRNSIYPMTISRQEQMKQNKEESKNNR